MFHKKCNDVTSKDLHGSLLPCVVPFTGQQMSLLPSSSDAWSASTSGEKVEGSLKSYLELSLRWCWILVLGRATVLGSAQTGNKPLLPAEMSLSEFT